MEEKEINFGQFIDYISKNVSPEEVKPLSEWIDSLSSTLFTEEEIKSEVAWLIQLTGILNYVDDEVNKRLDALTYKHP